LDPNGRALDTALPVRFGYREFWIDGRDFYLNGTRIHLSAEPFENSAIGAAAATYDAAKETMLRMQSFGINFVYTNNYDCEPGSHLAFDEILRAADDTGMLVALAQPHFSDYDWKAPDADTNNGYARHAAFYVHVAGSHPSVVFYTMSHNATGYNEDMDPDLIDGINSPRNQWASNNVNRALRCQAIVEKLDPGRIVYHHSSGNLGVMHDMNFYPNFAPIQELDDWFGHWAGKGVKPAFTCEYGAPFTWDWTMYRGWYKGVRSFGDAKVQWEFCVAEWASQFLGDPAFQITDVEKTNLRWEAKKFRAGATWFRWDYPYEVGTNRLDIRHTVEAMYITDNWRAYRTWGLSGNSPWEFEPYWRLRDGVDKKRIDLKTDWDNLQRPGYSPDYIGERFERFDTAFERADWIPTAAAKALLRNNLPLLAYIGGKAAAFTSKDHNFLPGETVEKQLIVINDSRDPVDCDCAWSVNLPQAQNGAKKVTVQPGDEARIPVSFKIPEADRPGDYSLNATFKFSTGEAQDDSFALNVMRGAERGPLPSKIALYDPPGGETGALLKSLGIGCQSVTAGSDLSQFDVLIIGKGALTVDGPGPDLARVRDGLKVVVFEQKTEVLEKRLGFRAEEYGLRQLFPRVADPRIGLDAESLRDWRGESTILPPQLKTEASQKFEGAPTVKWCDIDVTRIWRCGNRGDVASVLIEKPAHGDFLPLLDGGYSLQFSPLLQYREGNGMVLFCQADVTGRTGNDPAAELLAYNIVKYAAAWKPLPGRPVFYSGDAAGKAFLEKTGVAATAYAGGKLPANALLVADAGAGPALSASSADIADALRSDARLALIGMDQDEANSFLPFKVAMKKGEHIASNFVVSGAGSPFCGIGPADVYNRDPRDFPLVTGGALAVGDGILAVSQDGRV
ncbi:MAG TPA: glycoside hydrolase family 2 TIM barrel-domain containing protein, partial [Chthoniobacteraceae bacterium]|nr:glycoside hydrolase family 2 TIM barrel-domain containing protein [Chthoniobacteraceae bacterium]